MGHHWSRDPKFSAEDASKSPTLRAIVAAMPLVIATLLVACAVRSPGDKDAAKGPAITDDFYAFNDPSITTPGKLVRSEVLPSQLGLQGAGRQLRILYTSTDGRTGQGVLETSGAVFFPTGAAPARGWPVIAWAHGTVGVGDECAPSRNPRSHRDASYLNAWLREGFVVVATDYQGLGTPGPHLYLHARAQAYAVLDSVRATLALADVSNRIILLGQSQGGGAVFATAGYASAYAPELNVLGSVATGTPYVNRRNRPAFAPDRVNPTLAYAMYVGRTAQVFDAALKDSDVFTERALPVYAQSGQLCIGALENAVVRAGLTTANTLVPAGAERARRLVSRSLAYPTLKLEQPLFMGTGSVDVDVSTEQQIALAKDACSAGTRLAQHLYPGLDHSGTVNASLVDSLPFVHHLLAGEPIQSTCDAAPK